MRYPTHVFLKLLIPIAILLLACPAPQPPQQREQGITILGESHSLAPDSTASLLVHLRDPASDEPQANTRVNVTLGTPGDEEQVFEGQTDENGLIEVRFRVPEDTADPRQNLTISAGRVTHTDAVYVGRVYDVLVTTDKPVYQPGQTIHMRGLALDSTALEPARGMTMTLTVVDPEGNKLMRRELPTSQYGIAAADFALDNQAASGNYLVAVELGPVVSTNSVEVKPYTLPRFKVTFDADQPFYRPGEVATGSVEAHYFFGKPVANGAATMRGYVTDVERTQVFEATGQMDASGVYRYEFPVPEYLAGTLENHTATLDIELEVVDSAGHTENVEESLTVAEQEILLHAVPESGILQRGVENIIYVDATYPNGSAAQVTLTVTSDESAEPITVESDEYGLAQLRVTPKAEALDVPLIVEAVDAQGRTTTQELTLVSDRTSMLLRPDQAEYRIGDTMNLDIFVTKEVGTVYLDVIKGRQTFGLAALPVVDGLAQAAIDIDGSLLGTLELNAYAVSENGEIVRDRRLVLVNPAPAQVVVQMDAEEYRPGDTAVLDISASRDGLPMPGALGISIVDESVFEVGAQSPGFARTYFLIERELLEPRYEIRGFEDLDADTLSPYDNNPDSVRTGYTAPAGRELALFGLFGQELAARRQIENAQTMRLADQETEPDWMAWADAYARRLPLALPLLGLAFYDKTRRRRYLLIAFLLIALAAQGWVACSAQNAAPAAEQAAEAAPAGADDFYLASESTASTQGQAPRLRQFFPETLYWMPELVTDDQGHAQIEVPIADSITTWRVSILASDQDGNLGSAEAGLRVFQDFFVEPDLPRFLTVGDEIEVPVSIFNYLDRSQTVRLQLAEADWYELTRAPELTVEVDPNEVTAVYIPIRVTEFGKHTFQITALGERASDAIVREVEVSPNGQRQAHAQSGLLRGAETIGVDVPQQSILGTPRVTVKLYPGIVSQALDGLEALLQAPYGCFEQTSSTTYPNVMVLNYLLTTGRASPEIQLRAESFINLGYQRLLTFEVPGEPGGFSLFGDPPPVATLTAYGLMEFSDMNRVRYVDPALLERTAQFLMNRQEADGSWTPEYYSHAEEHGFSSSKLAATAYTAWALADAGFADSDAVQAAVDYIQHQYRGANVEPKQSQARGAATSPPTAPSAQNQLDGAQDPYLLALAANALVAAGADPGDMLASLVAQSWQTEEGGVYWVSNAETYMGSYGLPVAIETAALAAHALLRSHSHLDVALDALEYVTTQRDTLGSFHTTQATVAALRALLEAEKMAGNMAPVQIEVTWNGDRQQSVEMDPAANGQVQVIHFDDLAPGQHELQVVADGEQAVPYQVITEYYVPWQQVTEQPAQDEAMRVDVAYDRSELQVNDTVNVHAEAELLVGDSASTVIIDLGVPPGFEVVTEELESMVEKGEVARYELTGRQIILYLRDVPRGRLYEFDYRLRARYPIRATTPGSAAYNYYVPSERTEQAPQRIIVTLGTPGLD